VAEKTWTALPRQRSQDKLLSLSLLFIVTSAKNGTNVNGGVPRHLCNAAKLQESQRKGDKKRRAAHRGNATAQS
jgi:hypothetical protein